VSRRRGWCCHQRGHGHDNQTTRHRSPRGSAAWPTAPCNAHRTRSGPIRSNRPTATMGVRRQHGTDPGNQDHQTPTHTHTQLFDEIKVRMTILNGLLLVTNQLLQVAIG
jgi:hypothetical protein